MDKRSSHVVTCACAGSLLGRADLLRAEYGWTFGYGTTFDFGSFVVVGLALHSLHGYLFDWLVVRRSRCGIVV